MCKNTTYMYNKQAWTGYKRKKGYFSIRLINASLSIALTHFTNAYMSWEGLYMFRVIIYKKAKK